MERYKLSFTTGGLLLPEARITGELQIQTHNWEETRARLRQDNLFGLQTQASLTRISREVVDRLSSLGSVELELLVDGSDAERRLLLWAAATRQYRLIHEFASEVLRERYVGMLRTVGQDQIERFFIEKAQWSAEVADLTTATSKKLKQNLMRMLREADLVSGDDIIESPFFGDRLLATLSSTQPLDLDIFPLTDEQIARYRE